MSASVLNDLGGLISLIKIKLEASTSDFRWGQVLGFILGAACVAGAVYTAMIGAHPAVSVALVGLPIVAVVKAFLKK